MCAPNRENIGPAGLYEEGGQQHREPTPFCDGRAPSLVNLSSNNIGPTENNRRFKPTIAAHGDDDAFGRISRRIVEVRNPAGHLGDETVLNDLIDWRVNVRPNAVWQRCLAVRQVNAIGWWPE